MDPQQHGAREREIEVNAHELVHRGNSEGPEEEMLDPVVAESAGELDRLCLVRREPNGDEHADALSVQAPAGELEHARGGLVEPLDVVHGHEHRAGICENAQAAQEGGSNCPVVGRSAARLLEQERDRERPPLRRRKLRQRLGGDVTEQIGEPGESELHLGAARTGREDTQPQAARTLHPLLPQTRLPDTRLSLEEERMRPVFQKREKLIDACELLLPADEAFDHGQCGQPSTA